MANASGRDDSPWVFATNIYDNGVATYLYEQGHRVSIALRSCIRTYSWLVKEAQYLSLD